MDFEETESQKSEQLTLDFGRRGEAPRDQSKGRQVFSAATAGEAQATPLAPTLAQDLIEAMVRGGNVARALRRVETNRGAPGVDGMKTNELRPYLRAHWGELKQELLERDLSAATGAAGGDSQAGWWGARARHPDGFGSFRPAI